MESYLMITAINDFIFCPRSLYFSGIFHNSVSNKLFNATPQITGQENHKTIDEKTYSTRSSVITGLTVYSQKYNLLGVIDILDLNTNTLTERKYSITAVYDGFRYQLYAQYFALSEMGFQINHLRLHSVKDNKNYNIPLPNEPDIAIFEETLKKIRNFSLLDSFPDPNPNKCHNCIYHALCDFSASKTEDYIL